MLEVKGRATGFLYWVVFGLVLALLGWLGWNWLKDDGFLFRMLTFAVLGTGVVFVLLGVWKILDKRPVMVVDEQGLLDRCSLPSRRISWDEISDFHLAPVGANSPNFLAIDLVDSVKFVSNASFFVSGAMLEAIEKQHGTPCVIPMKTLDIEPHNLLERLRVLMKHYKR